MEKVPLDLAQISVKMENFNPECVQSEVFQDPSFQTCIGAFLEKMVRKFSTNTQQMVS